MTGERSDVGVAHDDGAVDVYAAYVAEQVALQEARKASIESRALVVITSAGALATLLLGLAAFASNGDTIELSDRAQGWLRAAVVAFVIAGVLALVANTPLLYRRVILSELSAAVEEADDDTRSFAVKAVAFNRLALVANAAKLNGWKAFVLMLALLSEVVAVAAIARCIWLMLG